MSLRSRELLTGFVFLILGAAGLYFSLNYRLGEGGRVGPGAFPALLAGILCLLGIAQLAVAVRQPVSPVGDVVRLRPILAITAAVLFFGFTVEHLGAVVALAVAAVIASSAEGWPNVRIAAIVYIAVLAFTVALIGLIELQLPLFWW